jgi:hypothetical protein
MTESSPSTAKAEDFSLVLGGPLFQLFRRAHLSGDGLELVRRRILVGLSPGYPCCSCRWSTARPWARSSPPSCWTSTPSALPGRAAAADLGGTHRSSARMQVVVGQFVTQGLVTEGSDRASMPP